VNGITIAPVLAAMAAAYYHENDKAKLSCFINEFVSGTCDNNEMLVRFRDQLKDSRFMKFSTRLETYLKMQRVIKAYMDDSCIAKIFSPQISIYSPPVVKV